MHPRQINASLSHASLGPSNGILKDCLWKDTSRQTRRRDTRWTEDGGQRWARTPSQPGLRPQEQRHPASASGCFAQPRGADGGLGLRCRKCSQGGAVVWPSRSRLPLEARARPGRPTHDRRGASFPPSHLHAGQSRRRPCSHRPMGSAPPGGGRATAGRYPTGPAVRAGSSRCEAAATLRGFTCGGGSGGAEVQWAGGWPRSARLEAGGSSGTRSEAQWWRIPAARASGLSRGSWSGERRRGQGVPQGLRLSPVALAIRNPPFNTVTFGSERVFQPRFAEARADLHPEKLIQHYVGGLSFRGCYDRRERWTFTRVSIVVTTAPSLPWAGPGAGNGPRFPDARRTHGGARGTRGPPSSRTCKG